ncbi:SDR family NAD(P)-dependent oxidoreductase [Kocuria tytonis]|uniref:SDR family NAD(P)-dependent oxidoreductase n=1 Tax=Kocuria tytonis TaxID=2054280 RepID=A0A495A4Y8_9MICC|nr:SDR family NAD(P)-dependent oxidoreductase [Kocuria tytonis]RKQ34143.1 SDR family NAD(P)-dependent oxidoreductase [Kocuria tytonis]
MTRTAVITGATGGIGRAFTQALHDRGYELVLTGRSTEKLTELSGSVTGGTARTVAADLGTQEGIDALVAVLESGSVDLLVNNAGFGTHGEFATLDLDRELEELTVNVRALMTLTHAALRSMTAARRGAIINIASVASLQPLPSMATYSASKAFVDRFTLAVGAEARKHGVHVLSVNPGPVDTDFFKVANASAIDMGRSAKPADLVAASLAALDAKRARIVFPRAYYALERIVGLLPQSLTARAANLVSGRG